jgi:hypothetical protein
MSDIDISVGLAVSVAVGQPPTYDQAGYTDVSLTYTEVGEVGSVPQFGGSGQVTEWTPLKTGIVDKRPGSVNYGEITLPLAYVAGDAGQQALQDGFDGANNRKVHSFKLDHPRQGQIYFTGVITGFAYNPGDANAIFQASATISVTSKPLAVPAA